MALAQIVYRLQELHSLDGGFVVIFAEFLCT
jgi:hypothetical protein